MRHFRAFLIVSSDTVASAGVAGHFGEMDETQLDTGDVLVRVMFSSVNYRDALAGTGQGRVVRRLPCVGGMDLAGVVVSSAAPRFRPGDLVMATGYDLGVAHHGGFAEYALVPGGWVLPVPDCFSLQEVMGIGTAGLAAAVAITRMEGCGLKPENGPVVVTGASGGVGALSIDMLAGRGYEVVALTSKPERTSWLLGLGAKRVMLHQELAFDAVKPMGKGLWAGVIDPLGGNVLGWSLATCRPTGVVASVGMLTGADLNTSVMPFVLRGVSLLGIDSIYAGFSVRERAWQRLSTDLRPRHLAEIIRVIALDELPNVFENLITGLAIGRTVVQIVPAGETEETP